MKLFSITIFLILLSITNYAQGPYNWINRVYDADDQRELDFENYSIVNGENILEYKEFEVDTDFENKGKLNFHAFFQNGQINKLIDYRFEKDTVIYGSDSFILDYDKQNSAIDSNGNFIVYGGRVDSTFSFYDEKGRKIRDSIPGSGYTSAHQIFYTYSYNSVSVKTIYWNTSEEDIEEPQVVYITDSAGNWTKKKSIWGNRIREIKYSKLKAD